MKSNLYLVILLITITSIMSCKNSSSPRTAGFAWPESLERVKGSAYVLREPVGDGSVITFADEPNYRMFWRGTLPLFLNSVLYSPSFTGS